MAGGQRDAQDARRADRQPVGLRQVDQRALQRQVEDLRRQRDEARSLLRRLTEQIGQALDAVSAVVPDERITREDRIIFDGNIAQLT